MKNTNEKSIIVFRSKSQTMKFFDFLSQKRVRAEIVNTPSRLGLGCGLSVAFKNNDMIYIKQALNILNLNTYAGIYDYKGLYKLM